MDTNTLKEWTSRRVCEPPTSNSMKPLILTYTYCHTTDLWRVPYSQKVALPVATVSTCNLSLSNDGVLPVCKDGITVCSLKIRLWHVGDITQIMGERLLGMWHDIGPTTVINFSKTHWSLASLIVTPCRRVLWQLRSSIAIRRRP
jgi:hypothetical protein